MMQLRRNLAGLCLLLLIATHTVLAENAETAGQNLAVTEEPVKAVHVLAPGEREDLSPNLIGLQNIAMVHLPLSINFINVIEAWREIVNGVRYEIFLNGVDTKDNDKEVICHLIVLEKPWLYTQWGDKVRELRYSNCSRDATLADEAAKLHALNDKDQPNTIFNGGTRNELTVEEMKDLESQIEFTDKAGKVEVNDNNAELPQEQPVESSTTQQLFNEPMTVAPSTEPSELSDDEKKWLDDFLSIGAVNFENSRAGVTYENGEEKQPQQQQEYVEQTAEQLGQSNQNARDERSYEPIVGAPAEFDTKKAQEVLQKSLDKLAEGDEQAPVYTIGKIYSAIQQIVSGTLTKIDADLIDGESNTQRCDIEIWSQPWLPNGNEVTFKCANNAISKHRHSRSVEYAEKKTHKKHAHHGYDKTEHIFKKFQMKYKKHYSNTMERQMRLRIFRQNLKTIEELNRNEMGSAKYGITEFTDMTSNEYKQRTGLWQRSTDKPSKNIMAEIPDIELPKEFDWREKGVVSEVKNQGNCGSCWAFSVTGNIEGLHAVKTGKLEEYSEQELLDCDTVDSACNGGIMDNAYDAIQKIGGLELESEYPYKAKKSQCHFNKTMAHVQVKGGFDLPKNETKIAQWLVQNGPISIGINANAMQFYRGGVSHPWHALCSKKSLDHGVLIVGYGVSDYPMFKKTLPYWIIKNSWGPKWGEQGYYRVYRGDNTCGVGEMATSAILA